MVDMHQYNNDTHLLTYASQSTALKDLLPNLAYGNDFMLNIQPSAYLELVPGCLTTKDEYAKHFIV